MTKEQPKQMAGTVKVKATKSLNKKINEELDADTKELSFSELEALGMVTNGKRRNAKSSK